MIFIASSSNTGVAEKQDKVLLQDFYEINCHSVECWPRIIIEYQNHSKIAREYSKQKFITTFPFTIIQNLTYHISLNLNGYLL